MQQRVNEKRTPTYDLSSVKKVFSAPKRLNVTGSAIQGAQALGLIRSEMITVLQSMERRHFFKSMTSHDDRSVWQDVYHVPFGEHVIYVKFTADRITQFRLLSFKEK